jgi:arabinofuranosyltransferase
VALAVLGWSRRWISDDGLIAMRTVRQVLAGNGPVFNVGERAEANTSALWTLMLTAGALLSRRDPAVVSVVVGLVCAVAGVALAGDGTRRAYRALGFAGTVLPAGALVVVALPPFWDFATSGLETGPVTLWLGAAWWLLVRAVAAGRGGAYVAAVVVGLGPLVRPDLALASGAFLLALIWAVRPRPRRALGLLAAAAAAPVAYQVFRMGFYGLLVPMPALAKEAREPRWERGATYLTDLVTPYALWVPLALLVGVAVLLAHGMRSRRTTAHDVRRWAPVLLAPVLAGLTLGLYVVRVGGDFMHGRLLLPALTALLLPVFVVPVPALRRVAMALVGAVAVWAVVCAALLRIPYVDGFSTTGIADERGHYTTVVQDPHPVSARPYVETFLAGAGPFGAAMDAEPPLLVYPEVIGAGWDFRTVLLGADAPAAGLWTNLGVAGATVPLDGIAVDPNGLAYTLSAHLEMNQPGRAGHEKYLPNAWALADHAATGADPLPPTHPTDVAAARRALACPGLNELLASVREPLTAPRVWDNLVGAPARTALRIPADPHEAERMFCPPDQSGDG